ncbi:contactin-associated protein like 5-1-like [Asterias amurensis]|uniref:contactin-associated protein like 5-1-like n=1 Tax=Asterias amurensis TaxID=7602 RepID=UPI003AB73FC7
MTNIPPTISGQVIAVDSDPYDVNINYSIPMEQITSLIDQSTKCYQILTAECKNAKIYDGENQLAWWVSRDGARMPNWGGATTIKGCFCYATDNCVSGNRCNCGANVRASDGGRMDDRTKLPVSALHFGSAAPPKEMSYRIENLMCYTQVP